MMKLRWVPVLALLAVAAAPAAAGAQAFPPAWNSVSHYVAGDLVQKGGNYYRCTLAVAGPNLDPAKSYSNWELYDVRYATTLVIGQGEAFPDFTTAWNFALNSRIEPAAYLHLFMTTVSGAISSSYSGALRLNHPFGAEISIVGDDPGRITLNFTGAGSAGVFVDGGHTLASISGISVAGKVAGAGFGVYSGGQILNLSNVATAGFQAGILAEGNSRITCGLDVFIGPSANDAVLAADGGSISFTSPLAYHPTLTGTMNAVLEADGGARIYARNCILVPASAGVALYGAHASNGGLIDISNGSLGGFGFGAFAESRGHIQAYGASFGLNTNYDLVASTGGSIDAVSAAFRTSTFGGAADGSYVNT